MTLADTKKGDIIRYKCGCVCTVLMTAPSSLPSVYFCRTVRCVAGPRRVNISDDSFWIDSAHDVEIDDVAYMVSDEHAVDFECEYAMHARLYGTPK